MSSEQLIDYIGQILKDGTVQWSAIEPWHLTPAGQARYRDSGANIPNQVMGRLLQLIHEAKLDRDFQSGVLQLVSIDGGSPRRVTVQEMAQWLVARSYLDSPSTAVSSLQSFVDQEGVPVREVVAILGVYLSEPIQIDGDLWLVPFSAVQTSYAKEVVSPPIFDGDYTKAARVPPLEDRTDARWQQPTAALTRTKPVGNKRATQEPGLAPGVFSRDRMLNIVALLSLLDTASPTALAYYREYHESVPRSWQGGWSIERLHYAPPRGPRLVFDTAKRDTLVALTQQLDSLSQGDRKTVSTSLQRLNAAVNEKPVEEKALDIGIALECLFLANISQGEQISLALRLRGAWWLGTDLAGRVEIHDTIKAIYDLRSQAAHRGFIDPSKKAKVAGTEKDVSELLAKGETYCRLALRRVLANRGFPDWNGLLLGAPQNPKAG